VVACALEAFLLVVFRAERTGDAKAARSFARACTMARSYMLLLFSITLELAHSYFLLYPMVVGWKRVVLR